MLALSGGEDRPAEGHVLDELEGRGVVDHRRLQRDVEAADHRGDPLARHDAQEPHPFAEAEGSGAPLEVGPRGAVTRDHEHGLGPGCAGEPVEDRGEPVPGLHEVHEAEHEATLEAERAARLGLRGRRIEASEIDAVRGDDDPIGRHTGGAHPPGQDLAHHEHPVGATPDRPLDRPGEPRQGEAVESGPFLGKGGR